jgi:hypothetical protein
MKWIYLMLSILILPMAITACVFFTIASAIDKYVNENHSY